MVKHITCPQIIFKIIILKNIFLLIEITIKKLFKNLIILFQIARGPDWEHQREKEEKLVADIINRVKRECEAQGETVSRRGYSRRTTVMNSQP